MKLAAENLLGIINDLLDFSKIEAGKLSLDEDRFSLRGALRDSLRPLAVRAHRKGLELVREVQAKVPDALVGDAGRLRQVLLNLVDNAINFTETGEVLVRVERVSTAGSEKVELGFTVSDTGIGILSDYQDKIFQAFVQEDSSTTRKYGGTGLGLTIAARLVDLTGGGRSRSTWQPDAPQSIDGQSTDGQSRISVQGFPVLIVDDSATNRRILEAWLSHWEMMPRAAANAAEALQFLSEDKACGRSYRLVLLDSRMPDVDGLTLAAQIRQRTEFEPIRVILLTSDDRPEWASLRELRIDAHLLKPVQQDELFDTIHRVMGRTDADAISMRRSALPSTTSSKRLRYPGGRGQRVQFAASGAAAYASWASGRVGHRRPTGVGPAGYRGCGVVDRAADGQHSSLI